MQRRNGQTERSRNYETVLLLLNSFCLPRFVGPSNQLCVSISYECDIQLFRAAGISIVAPFVNSTWDCVNAIRRPIWLHFVRINLYIFGWLVNCSGCESYDVIDYIPPIRTDADASTHAEFSFKNFIRSIRGMRWHPINQSMQNFAQGIFGGTKIEFIWFKI